MRQAAFVVAILSGKGGVGKTTISLNLARELSRRGPVWLVDIDLFNRGSTSALWESEKQIPISVAELVLDAQKEPAEVREDPVRLASSFLPKLARADRSISYDQTLSFVPGARAIEGKIASYVLWHGTSERGVKAEVFLDALITAFMELTPCGIVLLDGHGGLDELSLGAALVSDTTYIVNEPDLVTFTGSVTLYREIVESARQSSHDAWIEFIINRVSPRHSVEKLEQSFGPMLDAMSPAEEPVAVYFPLEPELFGVFGDDPFVSELYTRFWFSRKIQFLAGRVIDNGIGTGILHRDWAAGPSRTLPAKTRTALRREWYKRGDYILFGWLATFVVLLAFAVYQLLVAQTATPSSTATCVMAVALFLVMSFLVVTTRVWIGVQREHLRNVRLLRGKRDRRLRFGETASARKRDEVESAVKTTTAFRPLFTAFVILVVLGIIAAIAIPNYLAALQRSRQKRTMADMRTLALAVEARATDYNEYVSAGRTHDIAEIVTYLEPTYVRVAPRKDAWSHSFRYFSWPAKQATSYAIVSPGADGIFEDKIGEGKYLPGTTSNFDCDIVFGEGDFIVYPEGVQSQ